MTNQSEQDAGRLPSGTGLSTALPNEPETSSPIPASIPSAPTISLWVDQRQRQLRWEADNGPVLIMFPHVLKPAEIDDIEQVLAIALKVMRRTAQAIEAQL